MLIPCCRSPLQAVSGISNLLSKFPDMSDSVYSRLLTQLSAAWRAAAALSHSGARLSSLAASASPTPRSERLAQACLSALFFAAQLASAPALSATAASLVVERAAEVLRAYLEADRASGQLPLPRFRRDEVSTRILPFLAHDRGFPGCRRSRSCCGSWKG